MIEVEYNTGSGWKNAKTKKLCKLLKRIFGKHACIVGKGNQGYYDVANWDRLAGKNGTFVGKVYVSIDIELPEDFFEED